MFPANTLFEDFFKKFWTKFLGRFLIGCVVGRVFQRQCPASRPGFLTEQGARKK
jgi:hypothetical protein